MRQTIRAGEDAQRACNDAQAAVDKARSSAAQAAQDVRDTRHQSDIAAQSLTQARAEAADTSAQASAASEAMNHTLAEFGVAAGAADGSGLAAARAALAARSEAWLAKQDTAAALERDMVLLEARARQLHEDSDRQARLLEQTGLQHTQAAQRLEELRGKRHALIGDADPAAQEEALADAMRAAEQQRDQARGAHEELLGVAQAQLARINGLETAIAARSEEMALLEPAFGKRLQDAGFADEPAFVAARQPEEARRELNEEASRLDREHAALVLRQTAQDQQMARLRSEPRSTQPREIVEQERARLRGEQQSVVQNLAAARYQLEQNASLRQTHQARAQAIDAQRRECTRWDNLHDLIGSADGKKFRNFAQGLTFEMMIGHANQQLQEMTDRYLLVRDPVQPLELNVIDNYQAGEVRTTKNLSGGESFIVSLALALGLSGMASRNVRVDSLFLDEGFGTLDEDALDTALSTLGSLQQAGKLIGVISHVAALKERIGTQIRVTPQAGGRSVLEGPGCRRVA